ncbi:MAG: ABC transporter permease [Candidatus Paceibacterota bacterium]
MDFKSIVTIWKKEVRDTVRDRRTLFSMILMPMLLMPVMIFGMFKFIETQTNNQSEQVAKVAISGGQYSPELDSEIGNVKNIEIVEIDKDPKVAVADGEIDAAMIIPQDFQKKLENEEAANVALIMKSTNTKSQNVVATLSGVVGKFNADLLQERFADQKINPAILSNVVMVPEDVATQKELGGFILGLLIPLFIVMWSVVGGQYTAIDVSAGEKERKTLEALLLAPVKRIDIVFGKFLAVSTVALVSIITAIGSLYVSFIYAGSSEIMATDGINFSAGAGATGISFLIEPWAAVLLFVVSLFLVLTFSAAILSISIFAKSFKEAQSYISPFYIIIVLPVALVNSIPGFEPALWFFAVPAVNAVLLFKELLLGVYNSGHILLTLVSLAVYSAIALFIATKIYSKESVLFRD